MSSFHRLIGVGAIAAVATFTVGGAANAATTNIAKTPGAVVKTIHITPDGCFPRCS